MYYYIENVSMILKTSFVITIDYFSRVYYNLLQASRVKCAVKIERVMKNL